MKKILAVIAAAAAALTMSLSVFAADAPTITFDTDKCKSYIHTFGNASDTGLTYEITDKGFDGGALMLSESFTESISNQYGGIYFEASDFGLESFAGYTFTAYIKAGNKTEKSTNRLELFSDGEKWSFTAVAPDSGSWKQYSITVPANQNNTKFGLSIPITDKFDGEVASIDSVVISDNYGKAIANIGDVSVRTAAESPNKVASVLTTILFVILILAAIGGIVLFVIKLLRRYR